MPTQEERRAKLMSLVDVLEPLSEEELGMLARRCADISVRDGEDFYRPDEHDGGLFLVLEGPRLPSWRARTSNASSSAGPRWA